MEEETEFKTKAAMYRHHVVQSKNFDGSAKQYCEKYNLDPRYFYQYRSQMGGGSKKAKAKLFAKIVEKPVSEDAIDNKKEEALSDAKWLAEFANHYLNIQ